jgi:hypothetical protein
LRSSRTGTAQPGAAGAYEMEEYSGVVHAKGTL